MFILLSFSLALPVFGQRQSKVDVLIQITEQSTSETDILFANKDPELDGTLEILKSAYMEDIAYRFQVYKTENDTLRRNIAHLFTKKIYTHAYYHWVSSEIVELRLVNFETDEEGPVILLSDVVGISSMDIIEKGNLE